MFKYFDIFVSPQVRLGTSPAAFFANGAAFSGKSQSLTTPTEQSGKDREREEGREAAGMKAPRGKQSRETLEEESAPTRHPQDGLCDGAICKGLAWPKNASEKHSKLQIDL